MKNIYVYVGKACRRRILDANKICNYLQKNNHLIVEKPENADVIIIVTCAFRNELAETSLNDVKEFQKYDAELIVAGCLPEIEKEKLEEIFKGKALSTKNLDKIDELFPENKIKFDKIEDSDILIPNLGGGRFPGEKKQVFKNLNFVENIYYKTKDYIVKKFFDEHLLVYSTHTKKPFYHVRISWGCMGNCTYCAIKKAVGKLKSKPINQCITEFKRGVDKGYKNFVITADDIGAYGIDAGSSFPELLDKITSLSGGFEISIQDLHPRWVVKYIDDLEKILKRGKITNVNIALQSGNSRVLKLMNRYPDLDKMRDAFLRMKNSYPTMDFDTHFIVGFPTETDDEFKDTLSFVREIDFETGFMYRFSCKTGTPAENIEPKIPEEEITQRFNYAKKFLKSEGYRFINLSKKNFSMFFKNKKL